MFGLIASGRSRGGLMVLLGLFFACWFVLFLAVTVGLVGPTASEAKTAAETLGLRSVSIVAEHRLFVSMSGCGEGDMVGYELRGEMSGRAGDYLVCSGWPWKGWTLRTP